MPEADQFSMSLMVAVNLMTVAFALPWFMGSQTSRPVRNAQQFLLLHGLSWLLVFAADKVASTFWSALLFIAAVSAATGALWQLKKALKGWLGPRNLQLRRALAVLCLLTLAGAIVLILSELYRLAWFSTMYGLCVAALACLALHPKHNTGKVWRTLFVVSAMGLACVLLSKGYSALPAPWLQSLFQDPLPVLQLSWLMPFCSATLFLSILMACRDEELRQQASDSPEDSLTGLPRRQAIKNQARFMLHRARREQLPLAMILLDMDHFSRVNRKHGYQTGDEALQLMSLTLRKQMRGDEVVVRWKGESFCLLVHANQAGVQSLITRIKSSIQMGAQYELQVSLDFSAGCVLVPTVWQDLHLNELSDLATEALQQAKKQARGRVVFRTMTPPAPPTSAANI